MKHLSTVVLAVVLVLLAADQSVFSHVPPQNVSTTAYIIAFPNPITVNQQVAIDFGVTPIPPTATPTGGDRWRNIVLTIVKPDGTRETLGPFISNATGGLRTHYVPNQLGNYTLSAAFPGQILQLNATGGQDGVPSEFIGDFFVPSTSMPLTLAVVPPPSGVYPTPSPQPTSTPALPVSTTTSLAVASGRTGVCQTMKIEFWVTPAPPTATASAGDRWRGITVSVTKPDGTRETLGPFTSNATGADYVLYTPTMSGTYFFSARFPGQVLSLNGGTPSNYQGSTFLPSNSSNLAYAVQTAPVTPTPSPTPTSTPRSTSFPSATPRRAIVAPALPEFSLKFDPAPHTLVTTDPFTGANVTQEVPSDAVEITIKNPSFAPYYDEGSQKQIGLYYNVRVKGHYGDQWSEVYSSSNFIAMTSSAYTVIMYPESHPVGAKLDFQVEAIVGSWNQAYSSSSQNTNGPTYSNVFAVEARSGWSSTKTVTVALPGTLPSETPLPNPTPTEPSNLAISSPTPHATLMPSQASTSPFAPTPSSQLTQKPQGPSIDLTPALKFLTSILVQTARQIGLIQQYPIQATIVIGLAVAAVIVSLLAYLAKSKGLK